MGAAVVVAVWRRFPGLFAALTVSVVAAFLLGAVNAGFPHSPRFIAFVGAGGLGTAASFILVAAQHRPARSLRSGLRLFRRVTAALALQALLCITFVTMGYLTVDVAGLLYRKLIRS